MTDRWFRYVRLDEISDWILCGWLPTTALVQTHHGQYSVLCEWLCACRMVQPTPEIINQPQVPK